MLPDLLATQLDLLKGEIEAVDKAIAQQDEFTKNVKQWAIVAWSASVGGALTTSDLRAYVGASAAIPLLFWFVDTWHRRIQRKFIWRNIVISRFLNDGRLAKSIEAGHIVDFQLLDPKSRLDRSLEYEHFTSWKHVMAFRSIAILYCGMILISFVVAVASWLQ